MYFWLASPELAVNRVKQRVANGGHDIPVDVIERRYFRSIENLINLYIPLVDKYFVYNNSISTPELIAEKIGANSDCIIHNQDVWEKLSHRECLNEK